MQVLVCMEASGAIRSRLRDAGHDAYSCDFRASYDNSPHHFIGDAFDLAGAGWDALIFHFDCTYHAVSGAWAFNDPDFVRYPGVGYHQKPGPDTLTGQARREARERAELDWHRMDELTARVPIRIWENPLGTIWSRWKPYTQIVQPYQHGDDASKATGLRIEGLPPIPVDPAKYVKPRLVCKHCKGVFPWGLEDCPYCGSEEYLPRWANQTDSGQNRLGPKDGRAMERSNTYPGIAKAIVTHLSK